MQVQIQENPQRKVEISSSGTKFVAILCYIGRVKLGPKNFSQAQKEIRSFLLQSDVCLSFQALESICSRSTQAGSPMSQMQQCHPSFPQCQTPPFPSHWEAKALLLSSRPPRQRWLELNIGSILYGVHLDHTMLYWATECVGRAERSHRMAKWPVPLPPTQWDKSRIPQLFHMGRNVGPVGSGIRKPFVSHVVAGRENLQDKQQPLLRWKDQGQMPYWEACPITSCFACSLAS